MYHNNVDYILDYDRFVLLKERNMLLTMEHDAKQEYRLFPNPERIDKVGDEGHYWITIINVEVAFALVLINYFHTVHESDIPVYRKESELSM